MNKNIQVYKGNREERFLDTQLKQDTVKLPPVMIHVTLVLQQYKEKELICSFGHKNGFLADNLKSI
jgi:hypothetical protein